MHSIIGILKQKEEEEKEKNEKYRFLGRIRENERGTNQLSIHKAYILS